MIDLAILACLGLLALLLATTKWNRELSQDRKGFQKLFADSLATTRRNKERSRIRYFGRMGSVIMEGQVPEDRPRQYPHGHEGVLVMWDDSSEDLSWVPLWQLGGPDCWVEDPGLLDRARACHDDYQTKLDGMYE